MESGESILKIDIVPAEVFGEEVRALDPASGIFEKNSDLEFAREVLIQYGRALYGTTSFGFRRTWADYRLPITTVPTNTLPIFWSSGTVNGRPWRPLFPRA